nr:T9SS type A sorting domain-containing protein [Bacteroidota bacterium]
GNFLSKYTSGGEPIWAKSTSSNLKEMFLACEGTDIYAAGGFQNQINMDGQLYNAAPQGSACMYKVNSNGTICWTKTLGNVYAKFSSINIDKLNKTIWLSGGYSSQLNISTQTGTYSFSSPDYYGYNLDFFVLQADTAGSWNTINMVETVNGQMWGSTSNIQNGKFAVAGPFWGKAVFNKNSNGKDTLSGPLGNVSYDGLVAFFGNNSIVTETNEFLTPLNKLLVYPNPSNGQLTIDPNISSEYNLEIYDAIGKTVYTETNLIGRKEYSELHLTPGAYSIQIRSKQRSIMPLIYKRPFHCCFVARTHTNS